MGPVESRVMNPFSSSAARLLPSTGPCCFAQSSAGRKAGHARPLAALLQQLEKLLLKGHLQALNLLHLLQL